MNVDEPRMRLLMKGFNHGYIIGMSNPASKKQFQEIINSPTDYGKGFSHGFELGKSKSNSRDQEMGL